ncbi:S-layer homology domain-containing protein, partial [Flavonifractor plautii]|uniref:S-layer homology domain-containing protein n=1 Tax=Flavonifractor plautii TaxID=292800 RepID=UPI00210A739D
FDDFSDKDEIVNKDAVSMLTILGVINGKEDGSFFDPAGNVTPSPSRRMPSTLCLPSMHSRQSSSFRAPKK